MRQHFGRNPRKARGRPKGQKQALSLFLIIPFTTSGFSRDGQIDQFSPFFFPLFGVQTFVPNKLTSLVRREPPDGGLWVQEQFFDVC